MRTYHETDTVSWNCDACGRHSSLSGDRFISRARTAGYGQPDRSARSSPWPAGTPMSRCPRTCITRKATSRCPWSSLSTGWAAARSSIRSACRNWPARVCSSWRSMPTCTANGRSPASFPRARTLAASATDYSIWVHQSSVSHTARDVSKIIDALSARPEVDLSRIGVAGVSMGSSTCMVLAWKEPRISVVVGLIGAVDFWYDVTKTPPGQDQDAKRNGLSPRVRQLVNSIDPQDRKSAIAPKALFLANGARDDGIDIESVKNVRQGAPAELQGPSRAVDAAGGAENRTFGDRPDVDRGHRVARSPSCGKADPRATLTAHLHCASRSTVRGALLLFQFGGAEWDKMATVGLESSTSSSKVGGHPIKPYFIYEKGAKPVRGRASLAFPTVCRSR